MILDDGGTPITFNPTQYSLAVEDFTQLSLANDGGVIAAASPGRVPPRRTRQIVVEATSAQLATWQTFFEGTETASVLFTDEVGRVWTAWWTGPFRASESDYQASGFFHVSISLFLAAVSSDAGRDAYSNVDATQMTIQKSGGTLLYFPVAYTHPQERTVAEIAHRELLQTRLSVDATRYTAREDRTWNFAGLPAAFVSVLEDYLVDTLAGATHPFAFTHFSHANATYRITGGLRLKYAGPLRWAGALQVREET